MKRWRRGEVTAGSKCYPLTWEQREEVGIIKTWKLREGSDLWGGNCAEEADSGNAGKTANRNDLGLPRWRTVLGWYWQEQKNMEGASPFSLLQFSSYIVPTGGGWQGAPGTAWRRRTVAQIPSASITKLSIQRAVLMLSCNSLKTNIGIHPFPRYSCKLLNQL